jgi:hypothetical protein
MIDFFAHVDTKLPQKEQDWRTSNLYFLSQLEKTRQKKLLLKNTQATRRKELESGTPTP